LETALRTAVPERIALPAWTWLVLALALLAVYALTLENGATLRSGATVLHELFHDGRHFLGVPCH
jgi:putative cobalt transporter subunit CbtB